MEIAIIGSGAIGLAMAEEYARDAAHRVCLFSRGDPGLPAGNIRWFAVDILDEDSIASAITQAGVEAFDRVICCTGMLHSETTKPEKSLRDMSLANLRAVYDINSFAPILLAKHFVPVLRRSQRTVFAALSARVGSIGDNRLGGWYAYRSSKAALNMLLKTLSIETARSRPEAIVLGLHPGTVDSPLSKPYARNTAPENLFTPQNAVRKLMTIIENSRVDASGKVLAWDGQEIVP